ncbi:Receptor-like protein 4 [Linum grandiflorum]
MRISCGSRVNINTPPTNTRWYKDFAYTGGIPSNATRPSYVTPPLQTLRYFPLSSGPNNCYNINRVPKGHYAVRVFFGLIKHPDFDNEPLFDISVQGTQVYSLQSGWSSQDDQAFVEAQVFLLDRKATICFHSTGHGDPAVISIEILQIDDRAYRFGPEWGQGTILRTVTRLSCGNKKPKFDVDYSGDDHWGGDRFWGPILSFGRSSDQDISTKAGIKHATNGPNFYPKALYETAIVSTDTEPDLAYTMDVEPNRKYSIWLHFAEIDARVSDVGERVFDILVNGDVVFEDVDVIKMSGGMYTALVLNTTVAVSGRSLTNALGLPLRFGWNGDPCVPQQHPWSGADCQFDRKNYRWFIDGLGLDNQGLRGFLPNDISKLQHLQTINLSGNSIHGSIPTSIRKLTSLEVLLTDNDGLCGIPGLRTCGPHLSAGAKIGIGFGASVAFLLIVVCATCWWKRRQNILRAQQIARCVQKLIKYILFFVGLGNCFDELLVGPVLGVGLVLRDCPSCLPNCILDDVSEIARMDWKNSMPDVPVLEDATEGADWRATLSADSRQIIVNKIFETLKRHLPFSGQEGLQEVKKLAERFEEKIYTAETSQADYLRKISLKMLTLESKPQPFNSAPSPSMQSQVPSQGQSLPIPLPDNQSQALQFLPQNMQNSMSSAGLQSSAALQTPLPPVSGVNQTPINIASQNASLQNMSNMAQNPVVTSIGHGVSSNMFGNPLRQMPALNRAIGQQQKQQSLNPQSLYQQQQQQFQQQLLMKQRNLAHPMMQSQLQQQQQPHQNALQSSQFQKPQQSGVQTSPFMQPFVMQSPSMSSLSQNQSSSVQQSKQPQMMQKLQQRQLQLLQQWQQQQQQLNQQVQQMQQQQLPTQLASQQQLTSQIQSHPGQLQQQLGLNQQTTSPQREMQQRLQASGQAPGSLVQPQNVQIALAETSSTSIDSTSHTNGVDSQEEVYQKIKAMKERYMPELNEMLLKTTAKLQQYDAIPQPPNPEQLAKLKIFKTILESMTNFLQMPKENVTPSLKDKLPSYEKQIMSCHTALMPRAPSQMNPHAQSSESSTQQNNMSNVQHGLSGVSASPQSMTMNSSSTSQQANNGAMSSQSGSNMLQQSPFLPLNLQQQRAGYPAQQMKSGASFPIPKTGTANSPFVVPSLSTPLLAELSIPEKSAVSGKSLDRSDSDADSVLEELRYLRQKKGSLKMIKMEIKSEQLDSAGNDSNPGVGEAAMESGDWTATMQQADWGAILPAGWRQRMVTKIMETLKGHRPYSGQEGLQELKKNAERFEEKIYAAATSKTDYFQKISFKMLTMELKSKPLNSAGNDSKLPVPGVGEAAMESGDWTATLQQADSGATLQQADSGATLQQADWRATFEAYSRKRIVDKIMNILKRHLPYSGQEGLQKVKKIAERFEEKIFAAATSQVSLKMLTIELQSEPLNSAGNGSKLPDQGAYLDSPGIPQQQAMDLHQFQYQQQPLQQEYQHQLQQPQQQLNQQVKQEQEWQTRKMPRLDQNSSSTSQQANIGAISSHSGLNMLHLQSNPIMLQQHLLNQQQLLQPQQFKHQYQLEEMLQYPQQQLNQQGIQQQRLPTQLPTQQLLMSQKRRLMSGIQSHPGQLQQQRGLNQQTTLLQREMQQRLQASRQAAAGTSVQPQNLIDLQKQLSQAQSTSPDSTAQTGRTNGVDWQEDVYQKHDSVPPAPKSEQLAKLNVFKTMLEGMINFLQVPEETLQSNPSMLQQQPLKQQLDETAVTTAQQHQQHQQQNQQAKQDHDKTASASTKSQNCTGEYLPKLKEDIIEKRSKWRANRSRVTQQATAVIQEVNDAGFVVASLETLSKSQPLNPGADLGSTVIGQQSAQAMLQQQLNQQVKPEHEQEEEQARKMPRLDQNSSSASQQANIGAIFSHASLDSTAQTGQTNGMDWQEEAYQKIQGMKEMYLPGLNELFLKIASKLDSLPHSPKSDQVEKLKMFKTLLERMINFLQVRKENITPAVKDKLASYEKQIGSFLTSNRPKKPMSQMQQGQLPPSHMQPLSQNPQPQSHESQMNPQLQSMNMQSSVSSMQQNNMSNIQHCLPGVSASLQSVLNSLQARSNINSGQGNAMASSQWAMGSIQQNSSSTPQRQANIGVMPSQSGLTMLQQNQHLQSNPNMLQQHHLKQEHDQLVLQLQHLKQQCQEGRMLQQGLMSQIVHRQRMQQFGRNQQTTSLQMEMQQRLQASGQAPAGTSVQPQDVIDQQEQLHESAILVDAGFIVESLDSTTQNGQTDGMDWQEEVNHKHNSVPQASKSDQLEKLSMFKTMLGSMINFLQVPEEAPQSNPDMLQQQPLKQQQLDETSVSSTSASPTKSTSKTGA